MELKQVDTYSDDACSCDDNYSIKEQVECYVNDNTIKRYQVHTPIDIDIVGIIIDTILIT